MMWRRLSIWAACVLTLVACGATSQQPAATSSGTAQTSAGTSASNAKPSTYVTLPDGYGQNAAVVKTKLEELGLSRVELASSNTKYPTVAEPKDWKVVGMVPGAGTVVKSDDPVILKVVKVQ